MVDVWVRVAPNSTWEVGNCSIVLNYNHNALELLADNPAWNADAALSSGAYLPMNTTNYGDRIAMNIITFTQSSFVAKTGSFRLGTYRFTVIDGSKTDDFAFEVSGGAMSIVFHRLQQLPYNGGSDGYGALNPQRPQLIFPCRNTYYLAESCGKTRREYTETPAANGCLRWPRPVVSGGNPLHRIKYQYDFVYDQSPAAVPGRTSAFDFAALSSLADWARCRWVQQCPDAIEWETTPLGGRIWWAIDRNQIYGETVARGAAAITAHAVNPNDLTQIVDTAACGELAIHPLGHRRSEMVLNNTPEYFIANPEFRWTTDLQQCIANGNSPLDCVDFRAIVLHEFGHYIGINHERNPLDLMTDKSYQKVGAITAMRQCDADRVRRLYESQYIGRQPDNSTACDPVAVREEARERSVVNMDVLVYPTPVASGECTVQYTLPYSGMVSVVLLDMVGRTVQVVLNREQGAGVHTVQCHAAVPNGVYYLVVRCGELYKLQKVVFAQ